MNILPLLLRIPIEMDAFFNRKTVLKTRPFQSKFAVNDDCAWQELILEVCDEETKEKFDRWKNIAADPNLRECPNMIEGQLCGHSQTGRPRQVRYLGLYWFRLLSDCSGWFQLIRDWFSTDGFQLMVLTDGFQLMVENWWFSTDGFQLFLVNFGAAARDDLR